MPVIKSNRNSESSGSSRCNFARRIQCALEFRPSGSRSGSFKLQSLVGVLLLGFCPQALRPSCAQRRLSLWPTSSYEVPSTTTPTQTDQHHISKSNSERKPHDVFSFAISARPLCPRSPSLYPLHYTTL